VCSSDLTGRFWLLCLTTFTTWGIGHHLVVTHQVALALDAGFDQATASAVLALGGPTFSLGALVSLLSDRIGREATITLGCLLIISSLAALMLLTDPSQAWLLYYFALVFGLGLGVMVPPVAAAVTDVFQGPRSGPILGAIWFSFALGGGVGPWIGGWLFEAQRNYVLALGLDAAMYALGAAAVWLAGPRKVRLAPGRVRA
jgi:MFS family permease